ncbi:hypothetical protein CJF42_25575 [Pseudoalteromonas sp. NBT06-2]|uniref:hypothetical protein n=1 Tax=Pseudoalteromonas sp. NBT06-2 TaxID=2025950 RepID=UPI000BA7C619|nr:hypothetical protein [Pseudoalteromonas sp. NBT06-2]PAJ71654.1 hypothetical protein CJF42_25575 [Pseudoalteromonas sp. NBT06-2]
MLKIIKLSSAALALSIISTNSLASSYVIATPSKININESVTIDWSRYYPNKYPNQTYNLYVYKPSGEPKYKYRRGLTTTSDVRGPNTISGTQTIEVEVCDQNGQNCFTSSHGRVSVFIDHQCEYNKTSTRGAYYCDGNLVTQFAKFQPWPNGVNDSISDVISVKDRVYWKYTDRIDSYTTEYAWYTNCRSGGQIEQVTELVRNTSYPGSPNSFDRIDNFFARHNNDKAEWSFYDAWNKTSTPRTAYFSKC